MVINVLAGAPHPVNEKQSISLLLIEGSSSWAHRVKDLAVASFGGHVGVETAATVDDALSRLNTSSFDVCLLDYTLGKAGELQAIASAAHPNLVFMGEARKDWIYEALRHGAQDYIPKDRFDSFELAKCLAFAMMRKARTASLQAAALRDPLTGLGNRALFSEQFHTLAEQSRRASEILGLVFMDVDGLKPVNDNFGHAAGDSVLQMVTERILENTRSGDVIARIGGDEFAALLPRVDGREGIARVVEGISSAIASNPFVVGSNNLQVGLSCGVALFPEDGDGLEQLMHVADERMYAVKKSKRGIRPVHPPHHSNREAAKVGAVDVCPTCGNTLTQVGEADEAVWWCQGGCWKVWQVAALERPS